MAEKILEVRNLKKYFKTPKGLLHAVDGVNFSIEKGKTLGIVGESGCGKSTMLRAVAGLEDIQAGRIWIGDREVSELQPRERNIAMVFQDYALYPHKTVYENIAFGLKIRKLDNGQYACSVINQGAGMEYHQLLGEGDYKQKRDYQGSIRRRLQQNPTL